MRKVVLYIAASLDSYIAKEDGNVDWLHDPDFEIPDEDYGYYAFYESIDTTLMGYKTYKEVLGFDVPFPYPDKKNYVFTRSERPPDEHVTFENGDIVDFTSQLKNSSGKDIWLVGGGEINTIMLDNDLVDKLILTIIPITLGRGIPLFLQSDKQIKFSLQSHRSYDSGLVQLVYDRK